ncbi:MAG: trigger factor [Rickettsiaceae bacterium]|nr:trigger factor [Rickettsiaceae bacterium]
MKFTETKNEGLERHFKVTIPSKDIDTKTNKELAEIAKTAKLPGFRVGKVPVSIIQKKYGESVRMDVISSEARVAVGSVIKDNKLDLVGQPIIEDVKSEPGKDVEFSLKCYIMPKITMPDFKKIKITKPTLDITKQDIEDGIKLVSRGSQKFAEAKKGSKAADGDKVVIDFVGSVDGVEFEGGKAEGHELVLGSKMFIPGFEDQLIGVKAGDEVTVNVKFPEKYQAANLAGKDSKFEVKVHSVKKPEKLEINDEFAVSLGFKDMADLEEGIKRMKETRYRNDINTFMRMKLFDKLESLLDFDAPENMLDHEYRNIKIQTEAAKHEDPDLQNKTEEELDKYYKKVSARRVKIGMMLSAYARAKGIKVENEDLRSAIFAEARNYPGQEEKVFEYYKKNRDALEMLSGVVLENKAVDEIFKSEVSITEKKYSADDLVKMLDAEANAEIL